MRRPSGSTAHRAIKCPASMSLPQVVDLDADETASGRGSEIHAYLKDVSDCLGASFTLDEARESCLGRVREEIRPFCEVIDLEDLPVDLAAEVALAWDWKARTAREIGRGIDRQYGALGETEIPLTLDVLGISELSPGYRRIKVSDYKTGQTRYPRPGKFGQTLLGGLAAAVLLDADEIELELIYVDRDGIVWPARDVLDRWDLEAFGDVVERAMIAGLEASAIVDAGGTPSVAIGSHCTYCPSRPVCPGTTAMIRALPTEITGLEERMPIAREDYVRAFLKIEEWQRILGEIERQIFAGAWAEPIDLGDGRAIGRVESERESMDGPAAVALATRWYGEDAAATIAKVTTSIDAVKAMLRSHRKPKEKIESKSGDGLLDRFKQELRSSGGMKVSASETVKPYKLKKASE